MNEQQSISCTVARWELSRILERVQHGREHIILTKHNLPVAAIVPIRDAEKLEKERALQISETAQTQAAAPFRENVKDGK